MDWVVICVSGSPLLETYNIPTFQVFQLSRFARETLVFGVGLACSRGNTKSLAEIKLQYFYYSNDIVIMFILQQYQHLDDNNDCRSSIT